MRFFNTAGPCVQEDHYMLPAMVRLPQVWKLINRKSYFVLHAPRQSGKTTAMLELAREATASGEFVSIVLSMEVIDLGLVRRDPAAGLAISNPVYPRSFRGCWHSDRRIPCRPSGRRGSHSREPSIRSGSSQPSLPSGASMDNRCSAPPRTTKSRRTSF